MSQLERTFKAEFEKLLREKAEELQQKLDDGDLNEAVNLIQALQEARDQSLYQEVGRLTRALHGAIRNFHIDAAKSESVENISDMTDATDRLSYVVEMTEKAANKTMDIVEESIPIADTLSNHAEELKNEWQKLRNRELNADEFRELYWKIDGFFGQLDQDTKSLNSHLSNILLAQDYQDLTGQVIQKVTGLVREVEASLVDLVFMASQVESITGVAHEEEAPVEEDMHAGHGPQIAPEENENVVSGQDEVDDLLSSLGF